MDNLTDIPPILFRHLTQNLSAREQSRLDDWLQSDPLNRQLFNAIFNGQLIIEDIKEYDEMDTSGLQLKMQGLVQKHGIFINPLEIKNAQTAATLGPVVHRIHFLRTAWFRVAVAVLIILTGFFIYNQFVHTSGPAKEIVSNTSPRPDILPGGNKAMLTLADGSQIILDSAANGKLAEQTGATIQKSASGEIIYAFDESTVSKSVAYNTMSTPRGGQYQLILPDGSKVWLNAESSVTFPTAFIGNTREIKMTGEAYFEINPNATKPFIIKTISDEIQVLGTSFNINAYEDAPVKTSLLEGKVKVNASVLQPGQAYESGKTRKTNLDYDLAWRNGRFAFDHADTKMLMQQIARWYDVEVKYEGQIPKADINGTIDRSLTLQQMLTGIAALQIKFRVEGKTVIISQ